MVLLDFLFHQPNPWIDDLLHGDHIHINEDGEEVVSQGTPDQPVVIETTADDEPDPPATREADPAPERETHASIQIGGPGDDTLTSPEYPYTLLDGKGGDDTLVASGDAHNVMIGGPGNDTFDISGRAADGGPVAFIMDFEEGRSWEQGHDRIRIEDGDGNYTPLLDFYNRVMEAGLTFDMDWIATEDGTDVHVELYQPEGELVIKDTDLSGFGLEVIDGDLFIVHAGPGG